MTLPTVRRAAAITLGGIALLVVGFFLLLNWHFARDQAEHEAPIKVLVSNRATKAEVRDRFREPPFIGGPGRREVRGRDLLSVWPMSSEARSSIDRHLKSHPETWIYWGTYVDFLFFDSSGRLAAYETISN